jgi:hypothetical protein
VGRPTGFDWLNNRSIVDRDIPALAAMSANTLRIAGPFFASTNHTYFLDACLANGALPLLSARCALRAARRTHAHSAGWMGFSTNGALLTLCAQASWSSCRCRGTGCSTAPTRQPRRQ